MPKLNSLEVVHQDTNKDEFIVLHDLLVQLKKAALSDQEIIDGNARVAIENLLEMYVNDKEAFLRSLKTLTAEFKNSQAQLQEEILLRASELEALARKTTTLTAKTDSQFASVKEYSEAVASEVARKTTTYSQDDAPTGVELVYGDLWIDTNDNNRMYSWDGLVWNEVSKVNTFRQTSQPASASDGDLWYDTDDNNKLYRYNKLTGIWDLTADARVATTYARWGVQVDANGRVAGIQLNSDNTGTSQFTVLAEAFKVYNISSGLNDPVFTVQGGNVTPRNLNIISSSGQWILQAGMFSSQGVRMWRPGCNVLYSDNIGATSSPAIQGVASNGEQAIWGSAGTAGGGNHGIRGSNSGANTGGLVGAANGYDFYADGGGVNYGPFTGSHDALMNKEDTAEIGDIVVDKEVLVKRNISNTLCRVEKSNTPNQKGIVGVISKTGVLLANTTMPAVFAPTEMNVDDFGDCFNEFTPIYKELKNTHTLWSMNAVGEGQINVCGENGNIEIGDLIVSSSMPGKGMKQADDIIRSYTVAKARENVTFSSPTEVKQVACIYLCG